MVILLSALAVVVAAILLVTWVIVQGGFVLIYAAMGFAVLSMVLLWAARWMGSRPEAAPSAAPAPLPQPAVRSAAERPAPVPAPIRRRDDDPSLPVFPIADYDTLWVSQIVPLVAQLDGDELATVEARERGGRHRAAVLDAIASARTSGVGAPAPPVERQEDRRNEVPAAEADGPVEPAPDTFAALWAAPSEPTPTETVPGGLAGSAVDGLGNEVRPGTDALPSPGGVPPGATEDDIWILDDREPFDWTAPATDAAPPDDAADANAPDDEGPGDDGISFSPAPPRPAETGTDRGLEADDGGWDWSSAGITPPVVDDDLASLFDAGACGAGPLPAGGGEAGGDGIGDDPEAGDDGDPAAAPTVRMFLGRRQSSVTVRQR